MNTDAMAIVQASCHKILNSEPTFEVEQDYFDWEMAVTGSMRQTALPGRLPPLAAP